MSRFDKFYFMSIFQQKKRNEIKNLAKQKPIFLNLIFKYIIGIS